CPKFAASRPSRASLRRAVRRPVGASAPPVKGVLRITTNLRKQFFPKSTLFSKILQNRIKSI
ncbi:hypothetical protein, partial [Thalassovita aquimarina]|uniref:hypothetical protein n=1 Tax=Thalassovita aquimarina TaxID=2785917 RepID=UPI003564957A